MGNCSAKSEAWYNAGTKHGNCKGHLLILLYPTFFFLLSLWSIPGGTECLDALHSVNKVWVENPSEDEPILYPCNFILKKSTTSIFNNWSSFVLISMSLRDCKKFCNLHLIAALISLFRDKGPLAFPSFFPSNFFQQFLFLLQFAKTGLVA